MPVTATVVQGPANTWVVVVSQQPRAEQRYDCCSEKQAEALARLFSEGEHPKRSRKPPRPAEERRGVMALLHRISTAATAGLREVVSQADPKPRSRPVVNDGLHLQLCRTNEQFPFAPPSWRRSYP
jgi:hypothetical protein